MQDNNSNNSRNNSRVRGVTGTNGRHQRNAENLRAGNASNKGPVQQRRLMSQNTQASQNRNQGDVPQRRRINPDSRQNVNNNVGKEMQNRQGVPTDGTRQGGAVRQGRKPAAAPVTGNPKRSEGQNPQQNRNKTKAAGNKRRTDNINKQEKKKKKKIVLFIVEILIILALVIAFWGITQANKIQWVEIDDKEDIIINPDITERTETGVMKGYRNIALFGVDSREGDLDKNTRTDTIMIASINLDTKEIKLISVYRDTWLNLSTDKYGKANSAYAKGGPAQAINMLNMNLDMNITDYVTVGFEALVDVIDAVGGIEIDVKEAEIEHLNNYQICMVGEPDGTLNAAGEPNYVATAGVDYTPVTRSGVQTLNGLQATAYCRIRYVGNDFQRTERQRIVLEKVANKAITLNPATLNKIANAVFPKTSTSFKLADIVSLLSGVADYKIGGTSGFPFEGSIKTGKVGSASVVVPVDLEKNVRQLHEFFFNETDYEPTEVVKECSQKIVSDTGVSASQ